MNLLIILLIYLSGCQNSSPDVNYKTKNAKDSILKTEDSISYRKFEYTINNKSASAFSYVDGDLFDAGIKSMIIYGDYCLFVDEVNRNVKKINLKDGKKTVSDVLMDTDGRSLVDITIHNDLVYVSTHLNEIFVLDSDLKLVRTIELRTKGYISVCFFKEIKGNNLFVFIGEDSLVEIDTFGKEINRKKVNPYHKIGAKVTSEEVVSGKMVRDTIVTNALDRELYYYTYFERNEDSYIRGKKYRIIQKENKDVFVNDKHEITLATPYTHLENTDIGFINDIDFNDNYLVIFEVKPPMINIHVYAFKQ